MTDPVQERSRRLAQELAEQMRDRRIVVDEVPPTRSTRLLVWAFSLTIAALVGVAQVTFLVSPRQDGAGMPPGAVAALPASSACLARLDRITTALAVYRQRHGGYPAALAELAAEAGAEPAVCPFSGEPYAYVASATVPLVSCHQRHERPVQR
jgi:hypothetical protein